MRIKKHPILDFTGLKTIPFFYNDKKIMALEGDSIASALHAQGVKRLSHSLKYGRPRGFFCGIGKCSSCFMTVNDIPNVRTCIIPVTENMRVQEQESVGVLSDKKFINKKQEKIDEEIVIIGSGPAGLLAAITAAEQGASVLLLDENPRGGGQLIKQTHKFFGSLKEKAGTRGIEIAIELMEQTRAVQRIRLMLNTTVVGYYKSQGRHRVIALKRQANNGQLLDIYCKTLICACGAMENMFAFPGNDLPGVYGAGGVQTLMNVYGVKPGAKVLMVGAGNVGLIVSYQLVQSGVEVDRVVEALPRIGGYHVHAAKLRRCGVPIYTSQTIKEAYGDGKVEGAVVVGVDNQCHMLLGTEEQVACDTICLAIGLTPSIRLLEHIGVKTHYIPEAGGYVALHDSRMQTSVKRVYVAGDASGIEEASTAMIEGQLAGISAAASLGYDKNARVIMRQCHQNLKALRAGPYGEIPRICKEKITCYLKGGDEN